MVVATGVTDKATERLARCYGNANSSWHAGASAACIVAKAKLEFQSTLGHNSQPVPNSFETVEVRHAQQLASQLAAAANFEQSCVREYGCTADLYIKLIVNIL